MTGVQTCALPIFLETVVANGAHLSGEGDLLLHEEAGVEDYVALGSYLYEVLQWLLTYAGSELIGPQKTLDSNP